MKIIIWSIVIASVVAFAMDACSQERKKREYRPIPPRKVQSKTIELPTHDPNIKYYGPSSALFPADSVKWPRIKFN